MEELAQHILDLLMNSWEAEATVIELNIIEDSQKDLMIITVADNGRGMDEKFMMQALDPFKTGRKTRKVGLGLALLQAVAEACNGKVELTPAHSQGLIVKATFQRSHWDRPPLGDVAGTITAFLCSASSLRVIYTHEFNGCLFTFDSKQIEKIVSPVPVNHPKVLQWIRETIGQGLSKLYDGGE